MKAKTAAAAAAARGPFEDTCCRDGHRRAQLPPRAAISRRQQKKKHKAFWILEQRAFNTKYFITNNEPNSRYLHQQEVKKT